MEDQDRRTTPPAEPIEAWQATIAGKTAEAESPDHGMRTTLIVVGGLLAIVVLALLLHAGSKPGVTPPPAAVGSYTTTTHTVTYMADAEGTNAGTYTLRSDDGGTRQGDADLPMKNKAGGYGLSFEGFSSGDFVYLSVQNDNGYGSVTCRIVVDGQTISENTSTGGYKIATCSSQVP